MGEHIVVVDDMEQWRRTLSEVLQEEGYEVATAASLAEAKQTLKTVPYDLALVDVNLDPLGLKGEGGRLFDHLCRRYPRTAVIAITAGVPSPQEMRDLFVLCKIKDFVAKDDFNVRRFLELVANTVGDAGGPDPDEPERPASFADPIDIDAANPPLGAFRDLLRAAFTDQSLLRFCLVNPAFREVRELFGTSSGLAEMVDKLIEYCDRQVLWEELLVAVEKANPRQYALFASRLSRQNQDVA